MPSKYLSEEDRIIRYVSWTKLRRDEDDNVLGPLPQAFTLRPNEEYLSTTWCEYFSGTEEEKLKCAVSALQNSSLQVKTSARYCVGIVKEIADCLQSFGKTARFIHEPKINNQAYAAVRGWSDDDEILDVLASEIWSDCFSKNDLDTINEKPCYVSVRGAE